MQAAAYRRLAPSSQETLEKVIMMEIARWLVAFMAFVTAIGGLMADYFIPSSGAQHI